MHMCFTEGLGSLEVSHKFLGWFPRHLPHFNQPSFLYFVYQGTLHKFALDKKVLYFEGLHFFCFSTTAQVIMNISSSHMLFFLNGLNYSPLDRTFHLFRCLFVIHGTPKRQSSLSFLASHGFVYFCHQQRA